MYMNFIMKFIVLFKVSEADIFTSRVQLIKPANVIFFVTHASTQPSHLTSQHSLSLNINLVLNTIDL